MPNRRASRRDPAIAMAGVGEESYTGGMTPRLADFIEAGRALDADEREIAAMALQQVDAAEQAAVDAAWDEAIERRLEELTSGTVAPVSGRETLAIARARSAARRK